MSNEERRTGRCLFGRHRQQLDVPGVFWGVPFISSALDYRAVSGSAVVVILFG